MNKVTQFRLTCRIVSACFRINQIRIGSIQPLIADYQQFGESGGSISVTIHSHKRPVGDIAAQRKAALFDKYIDLASGDAEQEMSDTLSTLEAFANDTKVAA